MGKVSTLRSLLHITGLAQAMAGHGVSLQQEGSGPRREGYAVQQAGGLWMAINVQEAQSSQSGRGKARERMMLSSEANGEIFGGP